MSSGQPMRPEGYDPDRFPPFAVSTDVVVFVRRGDRLDVVLVRRAHDPFQGHWALPGGFVAIDEDLQTSASRELAEETGLACDDLHQLGAYGSPDRDPRMRVVSVAFWTELATIGDLAAADDADEARLWPVSELLANPELLAFDHHQILEDAIAAWEAA